MNSEIYINQVVKELGISFFEHSLEKRENIIWIDNEAQYQAFNLTTKWCQKFDLQKYYIWPSRKTSI